MRILLTVPSLAPEFGGPTVVARGLAAALRLAGHEVCVAGVGKDDSDGVFALRSMGRFHGTPIPAAPHRMRRLVRWADVVHVIGIATLSERLRR